jgi:hypothetical protein
MFKRDTFYTDLQQVTNEYMQTITTATVSHPSSFFTEIPNTILSVTDVAQANNVQSLLNSSAPITVDSNTSDDFIQVLASSTSVQPTTTLETKTVSGSVSNIDSSTNVNKASATATQSTSATGSHTASSSSSSNNAGSFLERRNPKKAFLIWGVSGAYFLLSLF